MRRATRIGNMLQNWLLLMAHLLLVLAELMDQCGRCR